MMCFNKAENTAVNITKLLFLESIFVSEPSIICLKGLQYVFSFLLCHVLLRVMVCFVPPGMASLEFTRTAAAKLGDWKIEVTVDGEKTTQKFTVDEYGG